MNTFFKTAAVAVLSYAALAVQAAPQTTVSLPRVVVTGKAVSTEITQLPRVLVVGYSESSLARRNWAAAATPKNRS